MGDELWRGTFLGTLCQVSDRPLYQDQLLVQWVIGALRRIGVPLLVLAFCPVVLAMDFPRMAPVRVDHHVHLNSPAIQAFLPEFCASVRRFGPCDPALTTPHSVQEPKSVPATSPVPVCLISSGTKDARPPHRREHHRSSLALTCWEAIARLLEWMFAACKKTHARIFELISDKIYLLFLP
jgi:hypothetical protein